MTIENLFIDAVNAYKDWWMCGRDFNLHANKFEAWDESINAYASANQISRDEAINQVRTYLGMDGVLR